MDLVMITAIPEIAQFAEQSGVNRIFVDMETRGKAERQSGANTPIYSHTFSDLLAVKKAVSTAKVMLRINPLHEETKTEVDQAIDAGADVIMLPYFTHPKEVEQFLAIVDGRATTNLLFETAAAVGRAEEILRISGYDEVHFGLNDLRLTLGLDFLFESLSSGLIEWLCSLAKKADRSYGIGGVGKIGKELLPAELIIHEHVRLGSKRVILSRVFHGETKTLDELNKFVDLSLEIKKLREVETRAAKRAPTEIENDRISFVSAVREIADSIRAKL